MLFFTRAFICIGTVVVLAEGVGPADLVQSGRTAAGALAPAAAAPVAALCRRKPDACMALAAAALQAGMASAPDPDGPAARPRPAAERRSLARTSELSSRPQAPR